MSDNLLDIVNDNDEIIGQRLRSEVHRDGLFHREVHVWFITPDRHVIFQKRGPHKESAPNMLDATAGGHVEHGQTYLEAATNEVREETGIEIKPSELIEICKYQTSSFEPVKKFTNKPFRQSYAYIFKGHLNDLKTENGEGAGFISVPLDTFQTTHNKEIIALLCSPTYQPMWSQIKELI